VVYAAWTAVSPDPGKCIKSARTEIHAKKGIMSLVTGHSARVRLSLILDDWELPADQLGPNFLLLTEPVGTKPVSARLLLEMDGVRCIWNVELPDGLPIKSPRVRVRAKPD
jgi:hypothetical protein